jgi:hypothetical protein
MMVNGETSDVRGKGNLSSLLIHKTPFNIFFPLPVPNTPTFVQPKINSYEAKTNPLLLVLAVATVTFMAFLIRESKTRKDGL